VTWRLTSLRGSRHASLYRPPIRKAMLLKIEHYRDEAAGVRVRVRVKVSTSPNLVRRCC